MQVHEAIAEQIVYRKQFEGGYQRLTYELPIDSKFLSCINGTKLLYVLDEDIGVTDHLDIWVISGTCTLPPQYTLKYLGSHPGGTTPVHYFCEEKDFASDYR